MATQIAPVVGNSRRREMKEVKGPEMFQFSKERPRLEGVFLGISRVTVRGRETAQYTIQDAEGDRFTFLGTYDLARKIQPSHVGHWMVVAYEGEDPDVKTQGSPMRRFRVAVSKEKEPEFRNIHGLSIADEEVPF